MKTIHGYHAHVYFDQNTYDQAQKLCQKACEHFSLKMGKMHRQPAGPHPRGSCQLSFRASLFAGVIPWLLTHRNGLTIFVHALTDNDYLDHTENVLWLGTAEPIDLTILSRG